MRLKLEQANICVYVMIYQMSKTVHEYAKFLRSFYFLIFLAYLKFFN